MALCGDCGTALGYFSKRVCPREQGGCGGIFCSSCRDYAVVTEAEAAAKGPKAQVGTFCKDCFKNLSLLDFGTAEEVFGPGPGEAHTLVYVHGGGGCRLMFRRHAQAMAARGLRCVLFDLPGHGARMDEPLTLETAISTTVDVIKRLAPPCQGVPPIYMGGSLGGYIGMELLGAQPDLVSAAIITMCGQNVGVGRGMAASLGLRAMNFAIGAMGQAMLLKGLVGEAQKNGHIEHELLLEMALRPGMFFGQGEQQVAILRQSNPKPALERFKGPVLFINGSKDHRDSEQIWKAAAAKGQLIVYEGADHFFSHDSRFMGRFEQDSWDFIVAAIKEAGGEPPASRA